MGDKRDLKKVLAEVDDLVDPEIIEAGMERQRDAWLFKSVDRPPLTLISPPSISAQTYSYREIFEDPCKMLIDQLETSVYPHLVVKDDAVPSVRADYGIVVIPSAFGCQIKVPENDMPWITRRALGDGKPDPDDLSEPVFDEGLPAKVLETEHFFLDALEDIGVHVYLADTQGPFNILHHLMGEKAFVALYKYPAEVREVLSKAADAYVKYTKLQKEVIGEPLDQGAHGWDRLDGPSGIWMSRGGVRLCDDSAAMLSPRHYEEYCVPSNTRCLEPFGGGMWHSCGRVSHLVPLVLEIDSVRAVQLGNPEMHSFPDVRRMAFEKEVCLVWKDILPQNSNMDELVGRFVQGLDGEYRGVIFSIDVSSSEEAKKLKKKWEEAFLAK